MTDVTARPDRTGPAPFVLLAVILGLSLVGIGVVLGQWIERDARPACRGAVRP